MRHWRSWTQQPITSAFCPSTLDKVPFKTSKRERGCRPRNLIKPLPAVQSTAWLREWRKVTKLLMMAMLDYLGLHQANRAYSQTDGSKPHGNASRVIQATRCQSIIASQVNADDRACMKVFLKHKMPLPGDYGSRG